MLKNPATTTIFAHSNRSFRMEIDLLLKFFIIGIVVIAKSQHRSHETPALSHACNRTLANTNELYYNPV